MNSTKRTYQIISLQLALLMLITSMGFTVDMHFCRGHLLSFSIFGKAETCQEMSELTRMKKCPHYKRMAAKNKFCALNKKDNCENKTIHFQFDQDQQIQQLNVDIKKPLKSFKTAYAQLFMASNYSFENDLPSFTHYKPPLICRDIPVLIESYLL